MVWASKQSYENTYSNGYGLLKHSHSVHFFTCSLPSLLGTSEGIFCTLEIASRMLVGENLLTNTFGGHV